jgi:uncharacterized protein
LAQFQKLKELITGKLKNELPRHLSYHNINHTVDVMQAAASIADKEGIDANDKRLLVTAALFHDTGFLIGREGHEAASCNIAREYLPLYGYHPAEIEVICNMIMATRIPQSPHNRLEEIICDADLDYLGRDDFFILSGRLFLELQAEGIVKDEEEWNKRQADFIGEHNYFTETSIKLRQPKREQYMELIKIKNLNSNLQ